MVSLLRGVIVVQTVEEFAKVLVSSGLLTSAELKSFWASLDGQLPQDLGTFAQILCERKVITDFQAQEILAGSGAPLVLGDYIVLDRIGVGGMGHVYKARHRHMKRTVALKVISPQAMRDTATLKRFQREVEAAARLEHPNIVTAHDSRHDRGVHYLVMSYAEGSDLGALVKSQGPLSVDLAVECVLQTARGLAYAHGEGVVHRDIKPANLLLDKNGVVKILDMGLARIEDSSNDHLTSTEQVMGTVDYMSPEQAASTHDVDCRADIYSLGCTLWYLLVGQKIYEGDTMIARMLKHREAPIPSLRNARPEVPEKLETIYQRMVAKHVEDRFQRMDDVVTSLETLLDNEKNPGKEEGSSSRALREFSRKLERSKTTKPSTLTRQPTPTNPGSTPTLVYQVGAVETDPNSEVSVRPLKKQSARSGNKPPISWWVAIAAGFVAAFFGVWVIIRDDKGKEVARISVEVPKGGRVEIAKDKLETSEPKTDAAAVAPPRAAAPFDSKQARAHQAAWAKHLGTQVETTNNAGMQMILIPPGEFMMGSTDEQIATAIQLIDARLKLEKVEDSSYGANKAHKEMIPLYERPQHPVVITRPFLMSETEVTVGQFKLFVAATDYQTQAEQFGFGGSALTTADSTVAAENKLLNWKNPGQTSSDDAPVVQVTWNDACAFCNWLSKEHGLIRCYLSDDAGSWTIVPNADGYRLPTEAEWEYACRAGTSTQFSFGDDPGKFSDYGWCSTNSRFRLGLVRAKLPNPFGLYDMHGNAIEWCQDYAGKKSYELSVKDDPTGPPSGTYVMVRGGRFTVPDFICRSAIRMSQILSHRSGDYGFRVVRVLNVNSAKANATTPRAAVSPPISLPSSK